MVDRLPTAPVRTARRLEVGSRPRLGALGLLLAFVGSWVLGNLHLAGEDHRFDGLAATWFHVATAEVGDDVRDGDVGQGGGEPAHPRVVAGEVHLEPEACGVLRFLRDGAAPPVARRSARAVPAPRCEPQRPPAAVDREEPARYRLAPKNSPPRRTG